MNQIHFDLTTIIKQYRLAVKNGDLRTARRWAEQAVKVAPEREEGWLYLAAVASPHASQFFLQKALKVNPSSHRARQGMQWAVRRKREAQKQPTQRIIEIPRSIPSQEFLRIHKVSPWVWSIAAVMLIIILISSGLFFSSTNAQNISTNGLQLDSVALVYLGKATRTPTFTPTFTPSPTPTITSTPTSTPTSTVTPTPPPTKVPKPTKTKVPQQPVGNNSNGLPPGVGQGERWIDINLSEQRTYAYEGDKLVNSFVVSTGTWQYPTVTGTFNVYVKYRYADMSGPGYYLPSVPYVMYFYQGYGLHGTYWHNNFGTPMSHGCVNLKTDDAGWIYNFSHVGIVVNVHY